jgi:P-type Ca2+ transporter type 2C
LLSISAVVSLALGLFQDFGTPREPGEPPVDWVEGVAIIIAIVIVVSTPAACFDVVSKLIHFNKVLVGSLNDWQKERQFQKLNNQKEERGVKVMRGGQEHVIDVKDVLVGDIALLEPGEIVPCDGVFITGHNVRCDESGATGESDAIQKMSYDECIRLGDQARHTDCFVVSGSKVLEGFGRYVVVAVGPKSFNGRIMMGALHCQFLLALFVYRRYLNTDRCLLFMAIFTFSVFCHGVTEYIIFSLARRSGEHTAAAQAE